MREALPGDFWDNTDYVVVYLYRYWDAKAETLMVSRDRATLLSIKSGLGTVLPDSGIKVSRSDLDSSGRFPGAPNNASES